MDSYHNVDAKTATKVRFMEPGSQQQANGAVDEAQEKLMPESGASAKGAEATVNNEKPEEEKDVPDEEARLISGSSPKPEKRENSEKETKENEQQNNEQTAEEKPPITP